MTKPSIEDRIAIEDLYADYCWALDSGNISAFLKLFVEDSVFGDTTGNIYKGHEAIRGYLKELTARPEFRGRQHILSNFRYTATDQRIEVSSFWHVFRWQQSIGVTSLDASGYSNDAFVKVGGQWLFSQRLVAYWSDTNLPWAGGASG